jgi:DNA-binding response OmpR family regulator
MSAATTIVFAREDLSIPGAAEDAGLISDQAELVQAHFFELVSRSRPDVIVLDFSNRPASGTETILTIRRQTDIPILVVCDPAPPEPDDYRIAGAADWIPAPVDILRLNETIQKILRVRGGGGTRSSGA